MSKVLEESKVAIELVRMQKRQEYTDYLVEQGEDYRDLRDLELVALRDMAQEYGYGQQEGYIKRVNQFGNVVVEKTTIKRAA